MNGNWTIWATEAKLVLALDDIPFVLSLYNARTVAKAPAKLDTTSTVPIWACYYGVFRDPPNLAIIPVAACSRSSYPTASLKLPKWGPPNASKWQNIIY